MVERGGLENRCPFTGTQGSNPCLSATKSNEDLVTLWKARSAIRIPATTSTGPMAPHSPLDQTCWRLVSANSGNPVLTTFDTLGLADPLLKAISDEGYTDPTPIQGKVIPLMLANRDVVGIAQTGTGKTASFVLPTLHRLIETNARRVPKQCQALILTPTRELAAQIVENIKAYSKYSRASVALIVGGVRPGPQIKTLSGGVDIVVATPGRLLDHLSSKAINLTSTHTVVIDEADQMLDLGFLPSIRQIMEKLPQKRQTALLSATMPTQIRKLANDFLNDPASVKVAAVSKPVERIAQTVRHIDQQAKRHELVKILSEPDIQRAVVFTRTKHGADRVCKQLMAANITAAAIHGNKSQNQRDRAMNGFRTGEINILVATDIAARGIDIDDVSHVVNFDLPNVPEAYVHRIGRTARAGRSGTAISFCDPGEIKQLRDIEKLIGNAIEVVGEGPFVLPDSIEGPTPKPGGTRRGNHKPRGRSGGGGRPGGGQNRKPKSKGSEGGGAGKKPSRNRRRGKPSSAA